MTKIDYGKIGALPSIDARIQEVETQLHNVKYVCLTDAIANYKRGGSVVFEALAEDQKRSMYGEQPRTWKIQMPAPDPRCANG